MNKGQAAGDRNQRGIRRGDLEAVQSTFNIRKGEDFHVDATKRGKV